MTVQYKRLDEIPFIAPEIIERQYRAFSSAPDATPELTATRMVRWVEAAIRTEIRVREERIDELEKKLRVIVAFLRGGAQP